MENCNTMGYQNLLAVPTRHVSERDDLERAFTLVELVIVIAIIGILAAVAIPRFIDMRTEAWVAQRDGIVGAVRVGIMLVASKNQVSATPDPATFPPNLETSWAGLSGGADCTTGGFCLCDANPCFELVLTQPIADKQWAQGTTGTPDANKYAFVDPIAGFVGPATKIYTYDPTDGSFD